jgi:hypothetical protein
MVDCGLFGVNYNLNNYRLFISKYSNMCGTMKLRIVVIVFLLLVAISTACVSPVEFRQVGGKMVTDCYGNLIPCIDATYNLGSATNRWHNIYVENIISGGGGTLHAQNTDTILTTNGVQALINAGRLVYDLKTDRWILHDTNTFFGVGVAGAGNLAHTALNEGYFNTAIGCDAASGIIKGYHNTIVGNNAAESLTDGYYNTVIGSDAGQFFTAATYNTALGYQSLANGTGGYNTAIGTGTLAAAAAGTYNTAVGLQSMSSATGHRNTALGRWSGQNNTGNDNVFLGNQAGQNSGAVNDTLYIDNSNTATPLIYGDFSTNKVTINEDLEVADDATVVGTLNLSGDALIKTDTSSARDLTVTTGAAKTIVLTTPVWEDLTIPMTNIKAPLADPPTFTVYKNSEIPAFKKDATNILYFSAQLPHSYKEGSDMEFHLHLAYPTNGAGNSIWYFTYSWANTSSAFPAASNSGNITIASPASTDNHQLAEIMATINGAGKTVSSVLLCSISRLGANGSDTYDDFIYLASGDFHFLKDTIGSRQQLVK